MLHDNKLQIKNATLSEVGNLTLEFGISSLWNQFLMNQ